MTAAAPSKEASPYVPTPTIVRTVVRELDDVFTLGIDAPAGFSFRPGQFNMLYVHAAGEVPISIAGDMREPNRLVHTIRAVGSVTRALERLAEGSVIGVRGPYGSAWPLDEIEGRDVLVVAGGLGLAPLRSAVLQILARRSHYGRVTILFGARTPSQLLYRSDLVRWRGWLDCKLEIIVDRAERDWLGNVGVITKLLPEACITPETAALVCGPEIMMRFVVRELQQRGVADSSVWLAMERNMKCGIGLCGHCQLGSWFVCKDGPIHRFDRVAAFMSVREV